MTFATDQTKLEFLSDVEVANGVPVVLARFGFKKVDIEGKKFLTPMTKQEALSALREGGDVSEEDIRRLELDEPWCNSDAQLNCYPIQGCKQCKGYIPYSSGWMCVCIAD